MGQLQAGYTFRPDEGEPIWLQGGLCLIKLSGEHTGDQFALAEQLLPRGMCTTIHVQPDEDEVFYILDGEVTFHLDGEFVSTRAGTLVCVPRGSEHGFRVESETARILVLNTPAGHERWFRAAGEPARERALPTEPHDEQRVAAAARAFGYTTVGPFPDVADGS